MIQPWYAPVISDGKYLVIRGGLSQMVKIQKEQLKARSKSSNMFGGVGGAIQGAKLAQLRFIYAIDKETNQIETVTPDYLNVLLTDYPELKTRFAAENEPENEQTIIDYLKLINKS